MSTDQLTMREETAQEVWRLWVDALAGLSPGSSDRSLSFVSAGGDSLAAVDFVGQVRMSTGLSIPVNDVLRARSFDEVLASARHTTATTGRLDHDPGLAWSDQQDAMSSRVQRFQGLSPADMVWALRVPPTVDLDLLARCIEDVASRHPVLTTNLRGHPRPVTVQRRSMGGRPLPRTQLATATACRLDPFDREPCRAEILQEGRGGGALLLLRFSHLVFDGFSWRLFAKQVDQQLAGRGPEHWGEDEAEPYGTFVAHQQAERARFHDAAQARLDELLNAHADQALPGDDRPQGTSHRFRRSERTFTRAQERVRDLARQADCTPSALMTSVVLQAVGQSLRCTVVHSTTPIANRDDVRWQSTVGLFADSRLMEYRPTAQPDVLANAEQVREQWFLDDPLHRVSVEKITEDSPYPDFPDVKIAVHQHGHGSLADLRAPDGSAFEPLPVYTPPWRRRPVNIDVSMSPHAVTVAIEHLPSRVPTTAVEETLELVTTALRGS